MTQPSPYGGPRLIWGWGVAAVVLFLIGWYCLRSERRDVAKNISDVVDVISDLDLR